MTQSTSTEKSVTYTDDEQIQLNQLSENGRKLANLRQLLVQGQFPGAAARNVLESLSVVNGLISHTEQQLAALHQSAEARTNAPAEKTTKKTKKGNGSGN